MEDSIMKNEFNDSNFSQTVAMLAVQVISQVINEAQTVVQSIQCPGEPALYTSILRKIRNGERFGKEISSVDALMSKEEKPDKDDKKTLIATSTPQKELDKFSKVKTVGDINGSSISGIGGGDETTVSEEKHDVVIRQLNNEYLVCNSKTSFSNHQDEETFSEIKKSFSKRDLNSAIHRDNTISETEIPHEFDNNSSKYSTYSLLSDIETVKDIKDDIPINIAVQDPDLKSAVVCEHNEQNAFNFYERTFLTLNRDEYYSEDGGQTFDDVKSVSLQDVELLPVHSCHEVVKHREEEEKKKEFHGRSRSKRPIMKQLRKNGVRLLAFLRNFWRRKTLNSKMSSSVPGKLAFRAMSPKVRRYSSILLDDRSSSPTGRCVRKFNTVNGATLFPQRWRKYASKCKLEEVAGVFERDQ